MLTKKVGCSASLAIIFDSVVKELAKRGIIELITRVEIPFLKEANHFSRELPHCSVLPISVSSSYLNATSSDVLVHFLMNLKLCYWPFQWDTGDATVCASKSDLTTCYGSGFSSAAKAALNGQSASGESAYIEAISRAAAHRLRRGIWTTTGGGDIKRCISTCEVKVLVTV